MVDNVQTSDVQTSDVQAGLEKIGATLRDARLKEFRTQSEVGELAGVSRQLVSRIEQGCNGEISAYVAVAAALRHRLDLVEEAGPNDTGSPGLDFVSSASAG
jgi:transcriptional regulator with XRE-family HTH domain